MSGWHVPSREFEVGWRCIPSQTSSAMLRGCQSCSTMSCRAIAPAGLALSGCNSLRECDALSRVWRTRQSLKSAQSMEACLGSGPGHSVELHLSSQATPEGRREMVGSRCCKRSKAVHQTWLRAPKHCMICRREGGKSSEWLIINTHQINYHAMFIYNIYNVLHDLQPRCCCVRAGIELQLMRVATFSNMPMHTQYQSAGFRTTSLHDGSICDGSLADLSPWLGPITITLSAASYVLFDAALKTTTKLVQRRGHRGHAC